MKATGTLIASVLIVASSTLALSPARPAAATVAISCGDTIMQSTGLTADIGPCPQDGLIIGADNITLDCNGHTVSGFGTGFGTGIEVPDGISGVTIKNCQVTEFGGNGFNIFSPSNKLLDNTVTNNGVGFNIVGVNNNELQGNIVTNNNGAGFLLTRSQ